MSRTSDNPPRTVAVERVFDAPPSDVWAAWTTPSQLAQWFNESPGLMSEVHELDVRPGGRMRLTVPPDVPADVTLGSYLGLFLVVDELHELGLVVVDPGRWACAMVRVTFEAVGSRTRLTLVSSLASDADREGTASAWGRCLDKLGVLVKRAESK